MNQSTKDEAKGKFHEVKGKVKEKIGRATNNPDLEAEGQDEKIGGNGPKENRTSKEGFRKIAETVFCFREGPVDAG